MTLLLFPDPWFYQEIRERGLNTSHESDDDVLDEPSSPEGTRKSDTTIVVKSYRPAQVTWSQLPEVGLARWGCRRPSDLSSSPWWPQVLTGRAAF